MISYLAISLCLLQIHGENLLFREGNSRSNGGFDRGINIGDTISRNHYRRDLRQDPSGAPTDGPTNGPTNGPTATTETTTPPPNCDVLCKEAEIGSLVSDCCSSSFCICPSLQPISCDELYPGLDYMFCPMRRECIASFICSSDYCCNSEQVTTEAPYQSASCYTDNMACKLESENLIKVVPDISITECVNECNDHEFNECNYFTHYSHSQESPISNECHLFRTCKEQVTFPGAVTGASGDEASDCLCSMEILPEDGIILYSQFASDEKECLQLCNKYPGPGDCSHYMFYEELSLCKLVNNPTKFYLHTGQGVRTGPVQCKSDDEICNLAMLQTVSHMLVDQPTTTSFKLR